MKQTAVEWLIEQICGDHTSEWQKEIEQAKEMEKEQIKEAWENGDGEFDYTSTELSEQYYNKKFKSE